MRRTLIMTVASTFVLAVAPGAALAKHHRHKHHRSHHHARVERFGTPMSAQNGSSSTSSSEDNAGTVASFSGGVLTLKLNDGSTVSGRVNNDTEIECQAAQNQEMARDDGGRGDDNSGDGDHRGDGDNQAAGENENEANEPQNEANGDQNEGNEVNENEANEANENEANEANENENENEANEANENENENENENGQACDSSSLTPGTVVREAELRVASGGASWKKVELQK